MATNNAFGWNTWVWTGAYTRAVAPTAQPAQVITPAQNTVSPTVWVLNPINPKDQYHKKAIVGIVTQQPQEAIMAKTLKSTKIPDWLDPSDLHTALSFVHDVKAGSGLWELISAYVPLWYSTGLVQSNHDYIKSVEWQPDFSTTTQEWQWWMAKAWQAVLWAWAMVWGLYWAGEITNKLWTVAYNAWLPKLEKEVAYSIQKKPILRTMEQTAKDYNLWGTRKWMASNAYAWMQDIFKNKIDPAIDALDNAWLWVSYWGIRANAHALIDENKQLSKVAKMDIKEAVDSYIEDLTSKVGNTTTYRDLQNSKSALDSSAPKKIASGKISQNAGDMAKKYIADASRDTLHEWLQTVLPESKSLMADYANLNAVYKQWIKAWLEKPLWGVLGMESAVLKSAAYPIATVWGKIMQNLWKLAKIPAEKIAEWVSMIAKTVGKWLKAVWPTLKELDPTWILSNIIENELYGQDLKWYQVNNFSQFRLMWDDAETAAKRARATDPNKFIVSA